MWHPLELKTISHPFRGPPARVKGQSQSSGYTIMANSPPNYKSSASLGYVYDTTPICFPYEPACLESELRSASDVLAFHPNKGDKSHGKGVNHNFPGFPPSKLQYIDGINPSCSNKHT